MGKTQNKAIRQGLRFKIEQVVVGTLSMLSPIKYVALLAIFLGLSSCRTQPPTVIQKEEVIWTYKDSIVQRDSTVYVPVEVYKDYSSFKDTLFLESSIAKAVAWNDTSNWMLNGYIENKQAIQYKYIEKLKVIRNDSIVELEKPIPYTVVEEKKVIPTFAWICIIWSVITLISIGYGLYRKFRP